MGASQRYREGSSSAIAERLEYRVARAWLRVWGSRLRPRCLCDLHARGELRSPDRRAVREPEHAQNAEDQVEARGRIQRAAHVGRYADHVYCDPDPPRLEELLGLPPGRGEAQRQHECVGERCGRVRGVREPDRESRGGHDDEDRQNLPLDRARPAHAEHLAGVALRLPAPPPVAAEPEKDDLKRAVAVELRSPEQQCPELCPLRHVLVDSCGCSLHRCGMVTSAR